MLSVVASAQYYWDTVSVGLIEPNLQHNQNETILVQMLQPSIQQSFRKMMLVR